MLEAQFLINIKFPIIIFIVTLIGDITDFYLPDIGHELNPLTVLSEVMGIFDFLTGNIIALSMIFISFFISLKFILKQGIKNSVMISFCITMVNIFSWFFLFPKSYNPNVCIVISVLLFGSAIWQGIKFREWFKEQKKRSFHSSLYN